MELVSLMLDSDLSLREEISRRLQASGMTEAELRELLAKQSEKFFKTVKSLGITQSEALAEALDAMQFYDDLSQGKSPYSAIGPFAITKDGKTTVNVTPMESALQNAMKAERSKVARLGGQALHAITEHARIKPLVIAEYEKNAAAKKADGRPVYSTKADFIRAMLDDHRDVVKDPGTISRWIKQSAVVVPHWPRAGKKKG